MVAKGKLVKEKFRKSGKDVHRELESQKTYLSQLLSTSKYHQRDLGVERVQVC